jgi:putative membrane protein
MIQLIISWFMSIGVWLISFISQLILLLPQLMFKPTSVSQGAQWLLKTLMEDPDDSGKDWIRSTLSHARYSIRHPHPPLTRDVQILIVLTTSVGIWSGYQPYDRYVWFMEMMPIAVVTLTLAGIFYRLPLTRLFYWLFFTLIMMGMVGAHYTYASVPAGDWMQNLFHFERNHFDRLTHFVQGLLTYVLGREILQRMSPVKKGKWLVLLSLCFSFMTGIFYELTEWLMAAQFKESSDLFLAHQGDVWDTQWDMVWSLIGSLGSLVAFKSLHQKQLSKLTRYLNNLPPAEKKELIA